MKKHIASIVIIVAIFIASIAWGASPAYENFKTGVFSRSGNTIQIAAGATNAAGELIITPPALASGTNVFAGNGASLTNVIGTIYLRKANGYAIKYSNLTNAINDAADGDTVDIGPGFWKYEQRIAKSNIVIRGSGAATIFANGYTNASGSSTPIISMRNNLVVENMAATNLFPNRYQCFIGSFSSDGDVPFTNVVVRNITGGHDVDFVYILQTNSYSAYYENVNPRNKWDSAVFANNTGTGRGTNIFVNCSFVNVGPNALSPSAPARGLLVGRNTTVIAYNSSFVGDQAGSTGLLYSDSSGYCRFVNCMVAGIQGTNVHAAGTPASIVFVGSHPSFADSIGSAGTINTPPWDAFTIENLTTLATNILVPLNAELVIKSGDEFSPADTTMGLTGDWTFPNTVRIGGAGAPTITSGAGAPSASEPNGSIYLRTDGGASTTLYVRISAAWVGK